jgi:hypothetical protein
VKGSEVGSIEGPGDNHKNVRMEWGHLKIILKNYEARKAEFYMKTF